MKQMCNECKKECELEELRYFAVDYRTCPDTIAVTLHNEFPVFICDECFKKYGQPSYYYMNKLVYEKKM